MNQSAERWRGAAPCSRRYPDRETIHDPYAIRDLIQPALELNGHLALQLDNLLHFLQAGLDQLLLIHLAGGSVHRERQPHLLGAALHRIEGISRQCGGGCAEGTKEDCDDEHGAQGRTRPSPAHPAGAPAPVHGAGSDSSSQPGRGTDDGQCGEEPVLNLVRCPDYSTVWTGPQVFLDQLLCGPIQFSVDSHLLPYLLALHLSSPSRRHNGRRTAAETSPWPGTVGSSPLPARSPAPRRSLS